MGKLEFLNPTTTSLPTLLQLKQGVLMFLNEGQVNRFTGIAVSSHWNDVDIGW